MAGPRAHRARPGTSRYQDQDDIDLSLWWALGRDGVHVISPGDVDVLPKVLDAASRFEEVPTDEAMRALNERADAAPLFV